VAITTRFRTTTCASSPGRAAPKNATFSALRSPGPLLALCCRRERAGGAEGWPAVACSLSSDQVAVAFWEVTFARLIAARMAGSSLGGVEVIRACRGCDGRRGPRVPRAPAASRGRGTSSRARMALYRSCLFSFPRPLPPRTAGEKVQRLGGQPLEGDWPSFGLRRGPESGPLPPCETACSRLEAVGGAEHAGRAPLEDVRGDAGRRPGRDSSRAPSRRARLLALSCAARGLGTGVSLPRGLSERSSTIQNPKRQNERLVTEGKVEKGVTAARAGALGPGKRDDRTRLLVVWGARSGYAIWRGARE
jgi:hypothetical protein